MPGSERIEKSEMAKPSYIETKEERAERLQKSRFFEVMSYTGCHKKAARLIGMGMQKAYRALADPDGITMLERHLSKQDQTAFYTMDHSQRIALLTKCVLLGYMPRVVFDDQTGEPTSELVYETVDIKTRLKCMDMINKMTCAYVDKTIVEHDKPTEIHVNTGVKRSPNEPPVDEEDNDPLDY